MNLIPSLKLNDKNRSYFKANMRYYLNQNGKEKTIIKRKYSRFNCMETSQYVACEIFPL